MARSAAGAAGSDLKLMGLIRFSQPEPRRRSNTGGTCVPVINAVVGENYQKVVPGTNVILQLGKFLTSVRVSW